MATSGPSSSASATQRPRVEVGEDQPCSLPGELTGGLGADTARRPGDQDGLAAQGRAHRFLLGQLLSTVLHGRDREDSLGAATAQGHRVVLPPAGSPRRRPTRRTPRSASTRPSTSLASSVSRAAAFTASPITVYSKRVSSPTLPATASPVATPMPGLELGHLVGEPPGHLACRDQGLGRVVVELDGCAEDGQHGVADELVHQALLTIDLLDDHAEEAVEQVDHLGRVALGGQRGGADDVDEQHRDHPGLAAELDVARGGRLGDVLADVAAEDVAQVLTFAQAVDHLVEPCLELAELGAVVHLDLGVEVALLDLLQSRCARR